MVQVVNAECNRISKIPLLQGRGIFCIKATIKTLHKALQIINLPACIKFQPQIAMSLLTNLNEVLKIGH